MGQIHKTTYIDTRVHTYTNVDIKYYIVDINGKLMLEGKDLKMYGNKTVEMEIHSLVAGHYYLMLEEGKTKHQRAFEVIQ